MSTQELDTSKLQGYLEDNIPGFNGKLSYEKFPGGQSNPTFKLSAGGTNYVLRRKPPGELLKSAHAVDREFKVISALQDTDVPVAKTHCLCEDEDIIGSMFYVMECLEGRVFWDAQVRRRAQFWNQDFFTYSVQDAQVCLIFGVLPLMKPISRKLAQECASGTHILAYRFRLPLHQENSKDDEAGPLFLQLEEWLHRPAQGARKDVDVAVLLAPYRDAPDPSRNGAPTLDPAR